MRRGEEAGFLPGRRERAHPGLAPPCPGNHLDRWPDSGQSLPISGPHLQKRAGWATLCQALCQCNFAPLRSSPRCHRGTHFTPGVCPAEPWGKGPSSSLFSLNPWLFFNFVMMEPPPSLLPALWKALPLDQSSGGQPQSWAGAKVGKEGVETSSPKKRAEKVSNGSLGLGCVSVLQQM